MSNELMVASTEHIEILEPEIVSNDKVFVAGRNWSSMDIRRSVTIEGHTIKEILLDALRREFDKTPTEFQESLWLSRCRCKVNGEEIEASKWDSYTPKAGEFVEFLVAPGKGGGGKNILNTVLMIAVVAVAIMTQQYYLTTYGTLTTGTGLTGAAAAEAASIGIATTYTAGSYAAAGLAAAAVMTVGTYAVNKICPVTVSPQQSASSQGAQSSNVYSINGSSNSANPYGYVPLVLGRFRYSGPLGAKSWTKQIGDDQYFNMLVIWGHSDMTAKDFRIGETPLSEFSDVDHVFHGATTGNDLKYFSKSYNEQSVGASLEYNEPVVRSVGECDSISVDIYFPALADASSGKTEGVDVTFNIEYALEGTEDWKFYSADTRFFAPEQYIDCYIGADADDAWCTADGTWHISQEGGGASGRPDTYIGIHDPHWETAPLKRYKDKHKHHEWWFHDAWYDAGVTKDIHIGAASTSPVTRSFEWAVPHGVYKVRITRVSEDKKKDAVYDDAKWSIARAITNRPAFNTPIPVCCSELRIRASEQLSGYVSDFNALCTSRFPIYGTHDADGEEIKSAYGWIKESDPNGVIIEDNVIIEDDDIDYVVGETVNPADHIRYLLTSRHALVNPYTESKIDEASLAKFAQYCLDTDYQFSLVCDSEAAAWNRLTAVASAGRGAITADNDGLFGVMVDNADKTVTQMFTPRNSWGFSIERSFYTLPHALRISFYDENDDYKQKEGFVYADGYNKENATDIVEWSMTGKTRWEDNYRMGRYYLASIKLRPVTITLSTDWEWMMCRRGDVVGVSHDVLLNTFGTARVVALIYRDENNNAFYVTHEEDMPSPDETLPIGVRLDDTVIFSEDTNYGIAIRSKSGAVLTYQVDHVLNAETADLIFTNSIVAAQCPYIGALASVSTLGNETAKYLVAAISVSDNNSAELTLVPWAMPEILESENGDIPAWEPPIYLPTIGSKGSLPAPSIRDIKSDESMLKRSGNSLIVCMGVWWNLPDGIDSELGGISVMGKIRKVGEQEVRTVTVDAMSTDYLVFENVEEGKEYEVQLRLMSNETGAVSEYSKSEFEVVTGKTSKPAKVTEFVLLVDNEKGIKASWTANDEADVASYKITGDYNASIPVPQSETHFLPYNKTGDVTETIRAVDVVGNESSEGATATLKVKTPSVPVINTATLLDNGINLSFSNAKTTWPIDYYQVNVKGVETHILRNTSAVINVPSSWAKNDSLAIRAKDIFNNYSEYTDDTIITWYAPKTPQIELGYDPLTGKVTIDWQDCRNNVANAPSISYYEITGTLTNNKPVSVTGTHYESVIPLKVYEWGDELDDKGSLVNVGTVAIKVSAVDKYGVSSKDAPNYKDNTVQLKIYPPYNPTNFGVSATPTDNDLEANWTSGGAIVLSWRDCTRTFAIDHYVVYDTYTKTSYKVSTNYVVLQARPEGSYPIQVTAYDVLGQSSSTMNYNLLIGGVSSLEVTASLDGADVLLEWNSPTASFQIDHYIIMQDNDTIPDGTNDDSLLEGFIGTAKTNYFRTPAGKAGSYTYYVWAVDIAGNVSIGSSYTSVTVESPSAPKVTPALSGDGVGLKWTAGTAENTLPILAWDVRRYKGKVNASTIHNFTAVSDYGRLDVDTTVVPAFAVGTYTFAIRGIDSAGNEGSWGFAEFTAHAPGKVTFSEPVIIDNNVQLYWTIPNTIFFPIKEYLFEEVDEDGYHMEIGRVDAQFANETENVAGTFKYSITPVDTGGNFGEPAFITCRVSQPPDFVFFDAKDSLFNGEKTNMVLDGRGSMLGPVKSEETWLQNIERINKLTASSISTHQNKVDAGYESWLEPYLEEGKYVEVIDHGTIVPGSNLTVTLTWQKVRKTLPEPIITCQIETSLDGKSWDLVSDNAFQVYAAQFQYTRITLTVKGSYIKISQIYVDLNVKKLTDYGRTVCYAADNGEGWESYEKTPMLTGTWIPFKVGFVAVQSLPRPNVVDNGNSEGYTAYTVFDGSVGNLNPGGFRVYVLDKNGKRVTAEVDWVAYGV